MKHDYEGYRKELGDCRAIRAQLKITLKYIDSRIQYLEWANKKPMKHPSIITKEQTNEPRD
jgi:hypothetical protein